MRFFQPFYPVGLVTFAVLLAAYKAARLVIEMGADWVSFFTLMGLDALYISLLLLIALLHAHTRQQWLRVVSWILLVLMTLFYLVDSFVLLALDEHARLFEIGRYAPEWGVVLSFFDARAYLAILFLLASMFVFLAPVRVVKKFGLLLLLIALFSAVLSAVYAPRPLRPYAMLGIEEILAGFGTKQELTFYSEQEIAFYAGLKQDAVAIPQSKPDIILLVVESLSSINSDKVSGTPGFLDGFDKLAEEGVLFKNFFANHQASEGGLIALLGGFPPIHFPTATPYMFDEFAVQPSVVDEYQQQGYFADFLTNADLGFIGLDHFLRGLGLDRSRGRDEVAEMRLAPRVVQDAPSDAYLYREALISIPELMASPQPFLLTIATTSTHLPYSHPSGGPDTPEAVWDWSLEQLLLFYSQLSDIRFFDNGVLLITGDHRQMRPVSKAEVERYGGSARARVPLLLIGKNYPRGHIDNRFFQQSDLLRKLGLISRPETRLSPHPVWVERYNRKYGRVELINNLSVFDESDQGRHEYRIKVPGNRSEWLGEKPEFARQVEIAIHTQRSQHQHIRNSLDKPSNASH
ncbi:MAG: sulfatase-like hydrolase/transferase [Xanthomonadales bacterium]|nr:sulfatase-like hydrolase/transferase [Xanthomonadales bacterium]